MNGFIVVPSSGQLQIPGSFQSVSRIIISVGVQTEITEQLTAPGEPPVAVPDYGFIAWRYDAAGVQRYGQPVTVRLKESLIMSDQPQLPFDQLLVVPRFGVSMNVSLRRISI